MMKFNTEKKEIQKSFEWAVQRALAFAVESEEGGPCYEASLPGRNAYCMRDMSHQAAGGHYLGLDRHNRNMIYRFAENISPSRDWCSFWEITFDGIPWYGDYTDDTNFWYNLPANFDIMRTCAELYELTGDEFYLTDPTVVRFHDISVNEYIKTWDRDGDGIVDRVDTDWIRGICSYDEGGTTGYKYALDTYSLQWTAFKVASKVYKMLGETEKAEKANARADEIKKTFLEMWWDENEKALAPVILRDGTHSGNFTMTKACFCVRDGLFTEEPYLSCHVDAIERKYPALNLEEYTYVSEIFYMTGRKKKALETLLMITDESCWRRDYPEVSYTAVADYVRGYMGIRPTFTDKTVRTEFGGIDGETASIEEVPVWSGTVSVTHTGDTATEITNNTGFDFTWKATVGGKEHTLTVRNGETKKVTA